MINDLPAKANLGCGTDYREGWHNVDQLQSVKTDQRVDLNELPWLWTNSSFEYVLMDNVIEHLDDQLGVLNELHRVVRPHGKIVLRFPHWNSPGHFTTPSHTTTLTHRSFEHYEVEGLFNVQNVDAKRVRFGKALPTKTALWLGDHIGHLVSEVEVELQNEDTWEYS